MMGVDGAKVGNLHICVSTYDVNYSLGGKTMKTLGRAVAILLVLCAAPVVLQRSEAAATKCDRACLTATVDKYLDAVVAHDPSRVKLSANVKFVENTVPTKPGEGLWKTASAVPTTFKIYVPDPVSEQVGFIGIMQESDKPIQLGLRLKIVDGQIT
jgi:hypothetical protein